MMLRTLKQVGIFLAGVVGGFAAHAIRGDSTDVSFDQIASEQCELRKGLKATVFQQRTKLSPNGPALPGVTDWIFWIACDGAPPPVIRYTSPANAAGAGE